jgi:hypothetical protein
MGWLRNSNHFASSPEHGGGVARMPMVEIYDLKVNDNNEQSPLARALFGF